MGALKLGFATILRTDNFPVYILAIAAAMITRYWHGRLAKVSLGTGAMGSVIAGERIVSAVLRRFNSLRSRRARGRTEYLGWVLFDNLVEMVVFSWIGVAYFLFTPYPWMIETLADVPVAIEAAINLGYTVAAIWGFRNLLHRNSPIAIGLAVGLLLGVGLYGFGTVNYGTAVRHRPMFLWVIFIFGAIGISSNVQFRNKLFIYSGENQSE